LLQPNTYSILRSINKAAYTSIGTIIKTPTYNDVDYKTQTNTCYRINYTDACDNQNTSGAEACPLSLDGNINKKNVITLSWNGYAGWKNGVKNYQLDKFNKEGGLINSSNVTATTFVDDQADLVNQQVSYKITALANDGALIPSTSNTITFVKETNLFYPTVFTPNGDSVNDTFTVSGQFIAKMDLKIYDRWGGLLFSSDKNEPWSGYINGKLLSEGAYVWKAIVTDFAGQTFSHTGTIFLITKK
jgi:gliding motility-associated-like protein